MQASNRKRKLLALDVLVNEFRKGRVKVVAACDSELVGKTFREGKLKLEVAARFYDGDLLSMDEAVKSMDEADIVNLVGARAVRVAVGAGLADPAAVIKIAGIPHVQIIKLG